MKKKKKKPTKTVFIRMLFTYFNNLSMIHSWTILPGSAFLEGERTTSSTMKWEYFGLCLTAKRQVGQVSELWKAKIKHLTEKDRKQQT